VREGRVEMCFNRAWGTICSDGFSTVDAGVVCTQLNYERTGKTVTVYKYAVIQPMNSSILPFHAYLTKFVT